MSFPASAAAKGARKEPDQHVFAGITGKVDSFSILVGQLKAFCFTSCFRQSHGILILVLQTRILSPVERLAQFAYFRSQMGDFRRDQSRIRIDDGFDPLDRLFFLLSMQALH